MHGFLTLQKPQHFTKAGQKFQIASRCYFSKTIKEKHKSCAFACTQTIQLQWAQCNANPAKDMVTSLYEP